MRLDISALENLKFRVHCDQYKEEPRSWLYYKEIKGTVLADLLNFKTWVLFQSVKSVLIIFCVIIQCLKDVLYQPRMLTQWSDCSSYQLYLEFVLVRFCTPKKQKKNVVCDILLYILVWFPRLGIEIFFGLNYKLKKLKSYNRL